MTERTRSRRRFLHVAGASALAGLAGCTSIEESSTPHGADTPAPTDTAVDTTATPTDDAADTDTPGETAEPEEGPGYKDYHWHGRLFFEVNGELVDFRQPKYYLENVEDDRPETVYFHFHADPETHGPNEWSNEKKVVTFARALNLLPGIGYERQAGEHVVTVEGTTYDARRSGTSISVHAGTESIVPTSYEVQHDDNFWVQVTTGDAKRTVSPAHDGADLGTLLFDVNNLRVDFSREKYLQGGSDAFHFHDDGHPYLWYKEGSITLQEALNSLSGIDYGRTGGHHVVEYHDDNHVSHSRKFDGGSSRHEIIVRQRTTDIDPTSYDLQAGDIVWIYVHSEVVPDNEH